MMDGLFYVLDYECLRKKENIGKKSSITRDCIRQNRLIPDFKINKKSSAERQTDEYTRKYAKNKTIYE